MGMLGMQEHCNTKLMQPEAVNLKISQYSQESLF